MIVSDNVRKSVAFLGYRMADGIFRMAGSAFFIGNELTGAAYAVTARHVIDEIRRRGLDQVWFRSNTKTGEAKWIETPLGAWLYHPTDQTVDVAILSVTVPDDLDHLIISNKMCVTDTVMKEQEVALGEEVFITGLFSHHHGAHRNIPIVRVGNLACLSEERVITEFGEIEAYLIEARSIGGLSGSPVFLNLGVSRMIKGQVMHAQNSPIFYLLGLIHGHFDVRVQTQDRIEPDKSDEMSPARINTGIAIVVPFSKIQEVIDANEHKSAGS